MNKFRSLYKIASLVSFLLLVEDALVDVEEELEERVLHRPWVQGLPALVDGLEDHAWVGARFFVTDPEDVLVDLGDLAWNRM